MKLQMMISILAFYAIGLKAQQVTFRGVNHCGIYPSEKNLLKEWPAEGPEKLWVVNDAGKGNSSALVSNGFIYTAGLTEDELEEQLTCYKLNGTKVWQVTYGHAWTKSYQETRSTPVIDGDRLYMVSNMGELVCLNRADGKILWTIGWQESNRDYLRKGNLYGSLRQVDWRCDMGNKRLWRQCHLLYFTHDRVEWTSASHRSNRDAYFRSGSGNRQDDLERQPMDTRSSYEEMAERHD